MYLNAKFRKHLLAIKTTTLDRERPRVNVYVPLSLSSTLLIISVPFPSILYPGEMKSGTVPVPSIIAIDLSGPPLLLVKNQARVVDISRTSSNFHTIVTFDPGKYSKLFPSGGEMIPPERKNFQIFLKQIGQNICDISVFDYTYLG